jgi:serine/threonine protein kinase
MASDQDLPQYPISDINTVCAREAWASFDPILHRESPTIIIEPPPPQDDPEYEPPIGAPIDIWAMGITLYCLIFGKVPFMADNGFELFQIISKKELEFPVEPVISPQVRHLLINMLEKDSRKRYTLHDIRVSHL